MYPSLYHLIPFHMSLITFCFHFRQRSRKVIVQGYAPSGGYEGRQAPENHLF